MPTYNGKYQKKYDLKKDYAEIKKEIKGWETTCDSLVKKYNGGDCDPQDIVDIMAEVEQMSHGMMSINM